MFDHLGQPRRDRLNQLQGEVLVPKKFYRTDTENKAFDQFRTINWQICTGSQLEDFFALLDDTITKMEEAAAIIHDSAAQALKALKQVQEGATFGTGVKRGVALLLVVINLICVWGELCLMINREYSLFYQISHVRMPEVVDMLLISTPILAYMIGVGSWSLTHLRLGSFFRFTPKSTNANTLNYFAIILCRLGPTIGFHYLTQIGATSSESPTEFSRVMGVMDQIVFIGDKWPIYAPILLILSMIFFAFSVPEKIAVCMGKEGFSFDYSLMNFADLATGEEVLKNLEPEVGALIDSGFGYVSMMNDGMVPVGVANRRRDLAEPINV
jgi:hypothetical protein